MLAYANNSKTNHCVRKVQLPVMVAFTKIVTFENRQSSGSKNDIERVHLFEVTNFDSYQF